MSEPPSIFFSALVLDLDGLLIDTEPSYRSAWKGALEDLNLQVPNEFWDRLTGCDFSQVESELTRQFQAPFSLARFRELSTVRWWRYVKRNGLTTKSGYNQLLTCLKEKRLPYCVATNSKLEITKECLRLAGIDRDFEIIVTRDQVVNAKPSPEIYLLAAKHLQQPSRQCLALEDSTVGISAAIAAGMIPIMIPGIPQSANVSRRETETVYILNSLQAFVEWLYRAELDGCGYRLSTQI